MLELFEEGGFDYGEADADAPFVADPHQAGLGLEKDFAFGQKEADIEQSRETQRVLQTVEAHASGAEVHSLHVDFFSLRIPDGDRNLNPCAKKFLLLVADEAERGGAFSGSKVDVVFLELAAKVRREMPSCSAARVRWPPVRSRALMIICSSMLSRLLTGMEAV